MGITVKDRNFYLMTKNTMYQMCVDRFGVLQHIWYGANTDCDMSYLVVEGCPAFCPNAEESEPSTNYSLDTLPIEYSCAGIGDYREAAIAVTFPDGSSVLDLKYKNYEIKEGKYSIKGLPASYETEDAKAQTLEIVLKDKYSDIEVVLRYGVFEDRDIITRSTVIRNGMGEAIKITKAASLCLDINGGEWDWINFHGLHLNERTPERKAIFHGVQESSSKRGTSSHQQNPSVVICETDCDETSGNCYGAVFAYSGGFRTAIEKNQLNSVRAVMGLNPELFDWTLESGAEFETPEVILTFSSSGFETLSHNFHKFIRNNVCRGEYKLVERPVLINSWEAMYFDFTKEKLIDFAKTAGEMGVDMLVLDDGWFGKRNDDTSSLGDWFEDRAKLPEGLDGVSKALTKIGMKFGLWFEPEMISEESELYRKHPDWAIKVPGRTPARCRHQLVLDMANPDVVDYLYGCMSDILKRCDISYIKWDMNRSICDWFSPTLPAERQKEAPHRYVLGLYDLLERLTTAFPHVLFEGCSGGGGRFDAGMLHYTPQIWCSDNTDAFTRTRIHYGTSFFYPVSTMGSHVSKVPNSQTGRVTPFETRSIVAMHGSFGYELDLNILPEEEKAQVVEGVKQFKKFGPLIHNGLYYRLSDPYSENYAAWMYVAEDKSEALVHAVKYRALRSEFTPILRLRGLDPKKKYAVNGEGEYSGAALMNGGVLLNKILEDYVAYQFHITEI